jgi:hypothetical protein
LRAREACHVDAPLRLGSRAAALEPVRPMP